MPIFDDPADIAASPILQAGRKQNYSSLGTGSFLLDLPAAVATDAIKHQKGAYNDAIWNRFSRPLLNADEAVGQAAKRALPGFLKNMMTGTEELPIQGHTVEGLPVKAMRPVTRLTEPLSKLRGITVPLLASSAFFNWRARKNEEAETRDLIDQLLAEQTKEAEMQTHGHQKTAQEVLQDRVEESAGLLKRASARIRELDGSNAALMEKLAGYELRTGAEKLAWEMVERGHCDPYADRGEFEAKVSAILNRGVEKVATALEMNVATDRLTLGEVKTASDESLDPFSAFVLGSDD